MSDTRTYLALEELVKEIRAARKNLEDINESLAIMSGRTSEADKMALSVQNDTYRQKIIELEKKIERQREAINKLQEEK